MATTHPTTLDDDYVTNHMHPRQAQWLLKVPVEDRPVVLNHAHFMQNISGGNLSGNLQMALARYRHIGADAMAEQDADDNARLMSLNLHH